MKIEEINILPDFDDIPDPNDDWVDVTVKLENGYSYLVYVATPQYLLSEMDEEKSDFLSPRHPLIIVRRLTQEIIENTIKAYTEGTARKLKVYDISLDDKTLDVLKARIVAQTKLILDLDENDESLNNIPESIIDFDDKVDYSK